MGLASCGPSSKATKSVVRDGHSSQNSLDWKGAYRGILPCADCEGMQTTLQLLDDSDYLLQTRYLGANEQNTFLDSGKFTWDKKGQVITLENGNKYFVGENQLTQLDRDGNKITGSLAKHYLLNKMEGRLKETYWKLVSLSGEKVTVDSSFHKEPHLVLKDKDSRFFGNAGCNNIMGSYKLEDGNGIKFSKIAGTLMACPDLKLEDAFKKVLGKTDHYSVVGEEMTLFSGKTPLAKFEAVYFH